MCLLILGATLSFQGMETLGLAIHIRPTPKPTVLPMYKQRGQVFFFHDTYISFSFVDSILRSPFCFLLFHKSLSWPVPVHIALWDLRRHTLWGCFFGHVTSRVDTGIDPPTVCPFHTPTLPVGSFDFLDFPFSL